MKKTLYMRFEIFTSANTTSDACSSVFWRHADLQADDGVSEELAVCIFRAEVAILGSGGICIGLEGNSADRMGCRRGIRG
jgi:hypothetical protein